MILKTKDLDVGYGKKTVVSRINIEALKGQFICLLGPNGCGKSTILKTIVNMLTPLGGAVYLNSQDISKFSSKELAKTVAVVLTDPITPGLLTAFDVVMLGRHPHTGFTGKPTVKDTEKVFEALKMVNAADLADRYFAELSDGEKQKTMLARALAQEPQLIVLDEPTSHLDARHRIEVMLILRQLTQEKGVTILASLHDIDLAMKACDIAILIKDERILACGPPEDILEEDLIAELYDMDKATFSGCLGGIELKSSSREPVYVVAGSGSGARLYRSLAKHGFGVLTGVLPQNDVDFHIAKAICATVIDEKPYHSISNEAYDRAINLMKQAHQVIDAGYPIGSSNTRNIELILHAIRQGKTTYIMRSKEEAEKIYDGGASQAIYCQNLSQLLEKVRNAEHQNPTA